MMQKMEMDLVSKVGASEGQGDNYNTSNSSEGLVAAMGKSCMLCLSPPCIKRKRDVVEVDEVETRASFSFPSVPAQTPIIPGLHPFSKGAYVGESSNGLNAGSSQGVLHGIPLDNTMLTQHNGAFALPIVGGGNYQHRSPLTLQPMSPFVSAQVARPSTLMIRPVPEIPPGFENFVRYNRDEPHDGLRRRVLSNLLAGERGRQREPRRSNSTLSSIFPFMFGGNQRK